ncbi:hypothetical protein [Filifactor villosus]|uniref:Uncharacterized protein n=1 Tax=Filifactor villosus TaxID=29374 RepID=A0ABV9QK80_9FIRM
MKKKLNICKWWININCMFVVFLVLLVPKDIQSLVLWVYVLSVSSLNLYIKAMIEKLPREDNTSKPLEQGSKQE